MGERRAENPRLQVQVLLVCADERSLTRTSDSGEMVDTHGRGPCSRQGVGVRLSSIALEVHAPVAKLVYAPGLGPGSLRGVEVRFLSGALGEWCNGNIGGSNPLAPRSSRGSPV